MENSSNTSIQTAEQAPSTALETAVPGGLYERGVSYAVTFARPFTWRGLRFLPKRPQIAQGEFLNQITEEAGADAVRSADRL